MSLRINKKNNALFTVVVVLSLAVTIALAWNPYIAPALSGFQPLAGVIPPEDEIIVSGQCQSGPNAPIALDKAWKLTLKKNTGGNIGTSTDTIVIYESDSLAVFEDNLDPASGVVTTGSVYKSGDTYDILYNNSNTQHWFRGIEVPFHCVDTDSNHYSQVTSYAIGTYVITLTYSGNTTAMETATGTYNYTSQGTTPTFTVRVDNTADNTGIISSKNPITGRDYKPVLQIILNGTGFDTVTMKSAQFNQDGSLVTPQYTQTVTKRIWSIELSEDNLSREVRADGTVVQVGTTSISYQLNLAGVSVDTVDMFIQLAGHSSNSEINDFGTATANDGVSLKEHLINIKS